MLDILILRVYIYLDINFNGGYMTCKHPTTERVKKLNGIQKTLDDNIQYIMVNCTECKTTLTGADIINGKVCNILEGSDIKEGV